MRGEAAAALATLLAAVGPAPGRAAASDEPPRPVTRVDPFVAPLVGTGAGKDMPAYLAYTQNTRSAWSSSG